MKKNETASWEHFSHEADMGIRGYGETIEAAFEQAATAMTAVICDLQNVKPVIPVKIQCEAPDHELLFVDWINALVYEMAVRRVLFSRYEITIDDNVLRATAWGEAIDQLRHQPAVEVKGATYTELKVSQQEDKRWVAQCVIDV